MVLQLFITALTIGVVQITETIWYGILPNVSSVWWNSWIFSFFDLYQFGLLLIFLALFFKRFRGVFIPIGSGIVINELNHIFHLFFPGFPPNSHQSISALVFVLVGYIVYALLIWLVSSLHSVTTIIRQLQRYIRLCKALFS